MSVNNTNMLNDTESTQLATTQLATTQLETELQEQKQDLQKIEENDLGPLHMLTLKLQQNEYYRNNDKVFDIVVFHYPCQDGLSSAYVVDKYHQDLEVTRPELYPIQHGTKLDIERFRDKKVIFCDYSPSLEVLEQIEKVTSSIVVLDHHITAKHALEHKQYAIFDMNYSGVGLTWMYFYPHQKMPHFLSMIQDRDLWRWLIRDSKSFTAAFYTVCSTVKANDFDSMFNIFNELYNDTEKVNFYVNMGTLLSKATEQKVQKIAEAAVKKIVKYHHYNVCIVNSTGDYNSDLGNVLSSKPEVDFAVMWLYDFVKDEYHVSLRSCGDIDVSKIANSLGGGGHKNASGCTLKGIHPCEVFCSNETKPVLFH